MKNKCVKCERETFGWITMQKTECLEDAGIPEKDKIYMCADCYDPTEDMDETQLASYIATTIAQDIENANKKAEKALGNVISSIAKSTEDELFSLKKEELERYFYF